MCPLFIYIIIYIYVNMVVSQIPSALNVAPLLLQRSRSTFRHVVHGPLFVNRDGLSSPLCAYISAHGI